MSTENQVLGLITKAIEQHKDELKDCRVYLFGSRSQQTQKSRSDFDIGILGKEPVNLKLFYQIEDEFDNLPTLYKIDWVDLNRASESFREHVLKQAQLIYG